jgi:hypothetical protein
MLWKNLKKTLNLTNKRSINPKARFTMPTENHFNKKTTLAMICILLIIFLSTATGGFGSNTSVVQANSVQGIGAGIYWDKVCTNRTLALNWGSIEAGSSNNLAIYVRNEGNLAVSLRIGTSNWTPPDASSHMSLIWNYSGQILKPNEIIPVKITLKVSPTIIDVTDFSCETIITTIG